MRWFGGLLLIAFIPLGLWWVRAVDSPALVMRRIVPTEPVLRGSPHHTVDVVLEVANTSSQVVELAPLHMGCSCQIAQQPESRIPPYGTTRIGLALRYPPAYQEIVPVELKSPTGEALVRTEIVLQCAQTFPYFLTPPRSVEIVLIEGVSLPTWSTSLTTVEARDASPYLVTVTPAAGGDFPRVKLSMTEHSRSGGNECERTYQLTFDLQTEDPPSASAAVHRGTLTLGLSDHTDQSLEWMVTRKQPLALSFDSHARRVRVVRRAGANGEVTLECVPQGSGTLKPAAFEAGRPIVAELMAGSVPPEAIVAVYRGADAPVTVSLTIP
ncbi:MAG: hypothetical protein SFV23_14535 [Planctomycetaceae bacterium]|nr:hypothetical protein [Planctomycetaceae bacterium]